MSFLPDARYRQRLRELVFDSGATIAADNFQFPCNSFFRLTLLRDRLRPSGNAEARSYVTAQVWEDWLCQDL